MGTLGKTALCLAISAALASPATALTLNPGGTGQVLVYPYYTVNGNQQTLVSVVNATNRVKAVKVRFLEGRNGRTVLDFNLYLGPFDAWAAAVAAAASDGPATLATSDQSCTVPQLASPTAFGTSSFVFANQDFSGVGTPASLQALLSSVGRTREGHVEVIEMGELQTGTLPTQLAEEATVNPSTGVPSNCKRLVEAWTQPSGGWALDAQSRIDLPRGGLYGSAVIVDAGEGTLQSYEADAIAGFYTNAAQPGFLHRSPLAPGPDLGDADNGRGQIDVAMLADDGTFIMQRVPARRRVPSATAPYSFDAVSLLYMHDWIYNEFVTEPALGAASEWVLSFPTRSAYVDVGDIAQVRRPFTDAFGDDGTSCEALTVESFDRASQFAARDDFDPINPTPPPPLPAPLACHQTTVAAFNQTPASVARPSQVLGSILTLGLRTNSNRDPAILSGSARIRFDNPLIAGFQNTLDNRVNDPAGGIALIGLPVTGFWAVNYTNANVFPGVLANYSGTTRHRTVRSEVPDP